MAIVVIKSVLKLSFSTNYIKCKTSFTFNKMYRFFRATIKSFGFNIVRFSLGFCPKTRSCCNMFTNLASAFPTRCTKS